MPKVTVSYEFADQADFNRHFGISMPSADDKPKASEHHAATSHGKPADQNVPPVAQPEQPAPAPQPEAPAGKTVQDCIAAFQRYVAKGNGRSAGKFMNEVMGPKYGARSIGQVAADRLGELYADFEAA